MMKKLGSVNTPSNYISLKLRNDGTMLNPYDPSFFNPLTLTLGMHTFARVNDNTTLGSSNLYPRRAMAFSTENASSPQLFSAFFQTEPWDEHYYFLAQKTTDWTTAQFKPFPEEKNSLIVINLSIFPNPTKDYFVLQGGAEEVYSLQLLDYLGKQYGSYSGSIKELNKYLKTLTVPSGTFLIKLYNSEKSLSLKAIKL